MEQYIINNYEICLFGKEDWDAKDTQHIVHQKYISVQQKHINEYYSIQWHEALGEQNMQADAIISKTDIPKGIWIYMADCNNIALLGKKHYCVIHLSWKTLVSWLLEKTIHEILRHGELPENLACFIGPSIRIDNYEVWEEFSSLFDEKYLLRSRDRMYLDMIAFIQDILAQHTIPDESITLHQDCTYRVNEKWRSYRKWDIGCRNFLWIRPLSTL